MADPKADHRIPITFRFSPALHAQLRLAAKTAGKDIESTVKSLLWIGLGALSLKYGRLRDDSASRPSPYPRDRDC